MVMRRGQHSSRVLETMRVPGIPEKDSHEHEVLDPSITGDHNYDDV